MLQFLIAFTMCNNANITNGKENDVIAFVFVIVHRTVYLRKSNNVTLKLKEL